MTHFSNRANFSLPRLAVTVFAALTLVSVGHSRAEVSSVEQAWKLMNSTGTDAGVSALNHLASIGDSRAMVALASLRFYPWLLPADNEKAAALVKAAVDLGDPIAEWVLATQPSFNGGGRTSKLLTLLDKGVNVAACLMNMKLILSKVL